jgi:hypothetical protein
MGTLFVELAHEAREPTSLTGQVASRGSRGLVLERAMHALMPCVLLGMTGFDEFREDPESDPPDRELGEASVVAKGTPLSVRMISGSPYSRKRLRKTCLVGP